MLFFLNGTATSEIYTLSLHDALPISTMASSATSSLVMFAWSVPTVANKASALFFSGSLAGRLITRRKTSLRSEEHTSELQSLTNLVCRHLPEKKNHPSSDEVDRTLHR